MAERKKPTAKKKPKTRKVVKKDGRPTKYDKKYCQEIVDYFKRPASNVIYKRKYFKDGSIASEEPIILPSDMPTFQGYANHIGVVVSTLWEWARTHEEFSKAYSHAKQIQEEIWLVNSMSNRYNAQFAKFFGVNCLGYKDRIETDNTTVNKNVDVSNLTDEQIERILNDE